MNSTKAVRMVKTIALASLVLGTAPATAEETGYSVKAISDAAYGRYILAGEYEAAINELEQADAEGLEAFYVANNLCVAYLKTGELSEAKESCDTAIEEIETVLETRESSRLLYPMSPSHRRGFLAIALANRGVVQAMDGNDELARADFIAAMGVRSRLDQPESNLAHLTQVAALSE